MSKLVPLAVSLALATGLAAQVSQDGSVAGQRPQSPALVQSIATTEAHGLPGAKKGTERWIVHFKKRSFDLRAFREAVYSGKSAEEVDLIVKDLQRKVIADQSDFVVQAQKLGATVVDQWWLVNACSLDIRHANLQKLAALPNVERLEPDRICEPTIKTATNSANHNADAVNAKGFIGKGVATAIVDTGQDSNMAATGRPHRTYYPLGNPAIKTGGGIGGSRLVLNKKLGAMPADDVHGHGTGVAGIAAGGNWGTTTADHGHAHGAQIAGYSIANNTRGSSTSTVIASAWQAVAADRVKYKIVSANNSYSGSPNPLDVAQKALDSAAYNADVMICVAAGNFASSTRSSQSAANGLAVAAVSANTHRMASFSSYGPLYGDTRRFYPDISGCGVSTVMPRRNLESSNYVASGTSMASPQVCGAATLLRSAAPTMKADETKAVLLCSALDISTKNPGKTRNNYGTGLLRDDTAMDVARSTLSHRRGTLTGSVKVVRFPVVTKIGSFYRVAIAWHRTVMTSTAWSNLSLRILDGTTVVASSDTPRNLYEFVMFRAKKTGYLAEIRYSSLQGAKQDFGFAYSATPAAPVAGSYAGFGAGCKGTGKGGGGPVCVSLNPLNTTNGSTGWATKRVFAHRVVAPSNLAVTGFQFLCRYPSTLKVATYLYLAASNGKPAASPIRSSSMTVGPTSKFYATTFPAVAITKGTVFYIAYLTPASTTFRVDTTTGSRGTYYWNGPNWSGPWSTRRFAWKVNCGSATGGAIPALGSAGTPEIGKNFKVDLAFAKASTAALLFTGFKKNAWGPIPLPLNLTGAGAPGCSLLAGGELILGAPVNTSGSASVTLFFPNDKSLVSLLFYQQYLVIDPGANKLGFAFSNGGAGKVGGTP